MENPLQSSDPQLKAFDAWLQASAVQPPADLLDRVRTRLREAPEPADEALDALFRTDPALRDPQMVAKLRNRLGQSIRDDVPSLAWFKWLTPLAAAATLTFAFMSFQSRVPERFQIESATRLAAQPDSAEFQEDAELTRIFALAANLQGGTDMSKLESVENLAFLFD